MIKPLRDRVLLEPIKKESKTASGIILTDKSAEKPELARVVAIGAGIKDKNGNLVPLDVKTGDVVVYKKYSSTEFKHEGNEYMIIDEKDILAVIKEDF